MPYHTKEKNRTSLRWFYSILVVITIGLLYWSYVMHPVDVRAVVEPNILPPDGNSTSVIRVVLLNRLGGEVPGRQATLRCTIVSGGNLVHLYHNDHSTRWSIRAGFMEGIVELRITSPQLIFPQTLMLFIEKPTA